MTGTKKTRSPSNWKRMNRRNPWLLEDQDHEVGLILRWPISRRLDRLLAELDADLVLSRIPHAGWWATIFYFDGEETVRMDIQTNKQLPAIKAAEEFLESR